VEQVQRLLSGETSALVIGLTEEMHRAAKGLQFEWAGQLRDAIRAREDLAGENSAVVDYDPEGRDYIAWAADGVLATFVIFSMRGGKMTGRELFRARSAAGETESLEHFITNYYDPGRPPPPKIYIQPVMDENCPIDKKITTEDTEFHGEEECFRTKTPRNSVYSVVKYSFRTPPAKPANPAAVSLVSRAANEHRYAIQLFGGEPESVYKAVLTLAPLNPDVIDINAGCPVPKVVKNGAGSALMKNPAILGKTVEAAVRASREALGNVPVTIKMRSGWDSHSINYAECARVAVEAGAAMVSLHPRTRSQVYSGKSDWACIANLVSRLAAPVPGSGDLYTPEDAQRMLSETGCAAVMFARGAMGNPFIFSAARSLLETGAWEPASFSARMDAAFRHLELLAADIGEPRACLEMRKQFCVYTKGLKGGAAVRDKAVHAQTIADYRRILVCMENAR
jgi:nifR3 family TIM-barrel protein